MLVLRNLNQGDGLIFLYKHIQESKLYWKYSRLTEHEWKKPRQPESMGGRGEGKATQVTLSLWKPGYKRNVDMMVRPVCASVDKFEE